MSLYAKALAKEKAPKKERDVKARSIKVDLQNYEMCFKVNEDGERVFDAVPGEIVVMERYNSLAKDKREFNRGRVHEIFEDGTVFIWDLNREEWFWMNWLQDNIPIVLRPIVKEVDPAKREKKKRRRKSLPEEASEAVHLDDPSGTLDLGTEEIPATKEEDND